MTEEGQHFTYPGSVVGTQCTTTEADAAKVVIDKATAAFRQPKNNWQSKVLSLKNKIRNFNTNGKAFLLYGAESWKAVTTVTTTNRIPTFVNSSLRRILDVCGLKPSVMNG